MNVYVNGNLALMPVIHIDVLLTPKKKATLPLASMLYCFVSNIAVRILVLQGSKQSNSLITARCWPIKGYYKQIYKCYIFIYVKYLHIQDIQYDSVSLYKGKISYKIFIWNQASLLLKERMIFILSL